MEILSSKRTTPAKERILQTAHTLFYRDGIRATGVDKLIAESQVTKTTFYRHFKSKNNLILAYLEQRHQQLLAGFAENIKQKGGTANAIIEAMEEWFRSDGFRGCAFLNSVGEIGQALPEVVEITQHHKRDMAQMFEAALPDSPNRSKIARSLALAVDGATVKAQYDQNPDEAIALLKLITSSIL